MTLQTHEKASEVLDAEAMVQRAFILSDDDAAHECMGCGKPYPMPETIDDARWFVDSEVRDGGTKDERLIALILCPECW